MKNSILIAIILSTFYVNSGVFAAGTQTTGYRSLVSGGVVTVTSPDGCRTVTNNGTRARFIPTKITTGWNAFRDRLPSGVSIGSCIVMPNKCGYVQMTTLAGYGNHNIHYWDKCPTGHLGTRVVQSDAVPPWGDPVAMSLNVYYANAASLSITGDTSGGLYGCPLGYTNIQDGPMGYNYHIMACTKN